MESLITSLFVLGMIISGLGQNATTDPSKLKDPNVFLKADMMPYWTSCGEEENNYDRQNCTEDRIKEWVGKNLVYPESVKPFRKQGSVVVRLVINEKGELTNPELAIKVHPLFDDEALRLIAEMPNFSPAIHEGKAVKIYYAIPFRFKLD